MKIALAGLGQMGTAIEEIALRRNHQIIKRFDIDNPVAETAQEDWENVDVVIDFTTPSVILENIDCYTRYNLKAVIGTTGWYDALPEVRQQIESSEGAILYAHNFSLGIALMVRALEHLSPYINVLSEFDVYVHEVHHKRKRDSPSGTAIRIGDALLAGIDRKNYLESETRHDLIDPAALHVSSTRAGDIFGQHRVVFDSVTDQLTIQHDAKNRSGFALGAVRAAEWVLHQKGLFTLEDLLDTWLTP